MSRQSITEYRSELDRIHAASGSKRESVVREAFKDLLKRWGRSRDLIFLAEHEYLTPTNDRRYIDGALVHSIRVPFGYWEAKDTNDDLDEEIRKKTATGYPRDNIIYEDTDTAVLIQNKREVARVSMEDADQLFQLLEMFFAYERPEIADFRKAVRQFAADLPAVLERLREIISEKRAASRDFARAELKFLDHAREAINPAVSEEDVQEMLIQHVLTEDIFAKVFDNPEFHRKNNVAAELYKLEETLFTYPEKQGLLRALRPYYSGIESTAALIESHSEKQQFLKGLYENFYKVYNPLAADRLGVVYTPGEIVRFMIRSADWLCHKHFGKGLDDRHVEILDPATGTGTYIVELLEHFRGNREKLAYKYREELHANEVAILPYYVANLNIEATYQAITGQFAEFPGLVFVDTLDNVDALGIYSGHQHELFGTLADENAERIKRQNRRKISVIIGNPPYNANQQNENDENKNREYAHVDKRIKDTYVKQSTARKPKAYDMYARFYRWASDRLSDEGIIAFITNRSFIWAKTYDGFRKLALQDFSEIWVCDLGGDWKQKGNGGGENVFGISTGVAICFFVKRKGIKAEALHYGDQPRNRSADDKLAALSAHDLSTLAPTFVRPDAKGNWIEPGDPDFDQLTAVISERSKKAKTARTIDAIFKTYTNGINTARDQWVYGNSAEAIRDKVRYFLTEYSKHKKGQKYSKKIKWSRNLKKKQASGYADKPLGRDFVDVNYRPFQSKLLYNSALLVDEPGLAPSFYPTADQNPSITITDTSSRARWTSFASSIPIDFHFGSTSDGYKAIPRYRYTKTGERVDNVTDWAVKQFEAHYGKSARITKDAVFAYCYGVLHDPVYREKYALNLKREFPRIPFYADFTKWLDWGQQLFNLHVRYYEAAPFKFTRVDTPNPKRTKSSNPKPKLKSEQARGIIIVDEDTQLTGIPREAWDYRLGNRSAIDWVLDQHKEKKGRDKSLPKEFNTYRFADYKESMIDLLAHVITVSLDTVKITEAMANCERAKSDV